MLVVANEIRRNAPSILTRESACRSCGSQFPVNFYEWWLPGQKRRSLIFDEVLNIAASNSGVETDAAAGAAAAAVRGPEEIIFGTPIVGEDIEAVASFSIPVLSTHLAKQKNRLHP